MDLLKELDPRDSAKIGKELHRFAGELYPIYRSITRYGIRRMLARTQDRISLQTFDVPTERLCLIGPWLSVPLDLHNRGYYVTRAKLRDF